MKIRKIIMLCISICIIAVCVVGCGSNTTTDNEKDTGKLNVVTTIFPYYDFIRQIAGDKINLEMVVPAGMDTHSFEPTVNDMINIGKADVFIYNGGAMESWVPQVIEAASNKSIISKAMMDSVQTVTEEIVEGMTTDEHDHDEEADDEPEYDEHIWTSPVNACKIVSNIADILAAADSTNASYYKANAEKYITKLKELDLKFQTVMENASSKYLVFGDRFPLRYFVDEYNLDYSAAFAGCSSDMEPSAETIAYLVDKVKEENVTAILKIELTSSKVAQSIAEATGARVETFYTCHNVTKQQFEQGVTYIELMEKNVGLLEEILIR